MNSSSSAESLGERVPEPAIGSVLGLLEASVAGGVVLLAAPRGTDSVLIVDAGARRDLVGADMRVPAGLLSAAPTVLPTDGTRVPLAWTIACGGRPSFFLSVPIAGHPLRIIAACIARPALDGVVAAAGIIAQLLDAGQETRAQADASRRIDALVRHLPVPLAFVDAQGLQVYINDQARLLLGLGQGALQTSSIAAALARLIHADGAGTLQRDMTRDPKANFSFEIARADQAFKVDSRWIDDDGLCGRIWIFSDITAAKSLQTSLARLASEDPLTNVLNRRSFESLMAAEVQRARRTGSALSLLVLDLDHFKGINDTYGHQTGDQVLKDTCRLIAAQLRQSDMLARVGGEEFAILLPGTPQARAVEVAERLCQTMRDAEISHGDARVKVTCSIGIAEFGDDADSAEAMIGRGDAALYAAKRGGRDRVALSGLQG